MTAMLTSWAMIVKRLKKAIRIHSVVMLVLHSELA